MTAAGRLLLGAIALSLVATIGCDGEEFARRTFGFTFESSLEPWEIDGTDLDQPPVTWSIERSMERSSAGEWAVQLQLDNVNDAGKIWIEMPVTNLAPFETYEISLAFDFGSSDGPVNAWRIIAGVSPESPETADDLTFQGSTEVPSGPGDFSFVRKEFTFTSTANATGMIWFSIGVWGTSEFPRTFYIDNVDMALERTL